MEERWKDIEGYEGLYQVSNLGRVRSLNYRNLGYVKVLNQSVGPHGYMRISLHKKSYLIHRLVANAFLPKIEGLNIVNHKDENKKNNSVENLEWCDSKHNYHYSKYSNKNFLERQTKGFIREKAYKKRARNPYKHFYKVKQIDRNGCLINIFENPTKASEELGIQVGHIVACVNGKEKSIHGYTFRKIDD